MIMIIFVVVTFMIMIITRFVSPHLHQRPCTTPPTRFPTCQFGKCKRQFLRKYEGNWEEIARKFKTILKNVEEESFDEEKEKEKKYLERNRWLGLSNSTNYLSIYLFIYLFIGNKPHSTIYSFIPNKFIYLFKQKFCSLVTVDPVISNYHPKPDFPHHHCLQYKSMSQIIPLDSIVTLYFWMTLQQTYVGVTKGDYRTQAL